MTLNLGVEGGYASAQARAHNFRKEYIKGLYRKEYSFREVVNLTWMGGDYDYLKKIKLKDILNAMPGWDDVTATEALMHFGFGIKDTIGNIRRNESMVDNFTHLMRTTADTWKPKPTMPDGYPFFGKITYALAMSANDGIEVNIPEEIIDITPEPEDGWEKTHNKKRFANSEERDAILDILSSGDEGIDDEIDMELNDLLE